MTALKREKLHPVLKGIFKRGADVRVPLSDTMIKVPTARRTAVNLVNSYGPASEYVINFGTEEGGVFHGGYQVPFPGPQMDWQAIAQAREITFQLEQLAQLLYTPRVFLNGSR